MKWNCPECGGECAEERLTDGKNGIVCPLCGAEVVSNEGEE
jgi:DNA-directed RNA polymerase subunit RPC12/RpoP